ncbi:CocE/NonD family hydrolase [Pararhizobium mangrovi]|uniref:CocE/NonD family hydrolase n=1 Tax=Pararhizobium mangrovi TaxID=2590452 RepID=A0A506UBI5_9HYPH|nr:CocE/NonD family hydrolase [Pararhizobium mangrovi]
MIFEKDVEIAMRDGLHLRANVFRPTTPGRYPVILAHGVYGKDVHFRDAFKPQWEVLTGLYPDLDKGASSGRFLRWETADPERWVPDGYVLVSVDARGSGKSPGYLDPFSPTETMDHFELIEWAGTREWSSGKVGLLGVSYFAIKQWQVAALRPPHLAAIVPWEGASDFYREWARHGGILSHGFPAAWLPRQVSVNQNGNGNSPLVDPDTGERTTGPALEEGILAGNIADHMSDLHRHELDDDWHRERSPDLSRIEVPVLSAANWGGPGLHLRGNIEGYLRTGSQRKWLQLHVGTHYESFYLPDFVSRQKRFFDRFLKDIDNGFDHEPAIRFAVRHPDGAVWREAESWPLPQTRWTSYHLDADRLGLMPAGGSGSDASVTFEADGDGVEFLTPAFEEAVEFTGPVALKLQASSTTDDMDIFAVLRLLDPDGDEVRFTGAHEEVPVARGWLRASHRALDPHRSTPYRPFHTHRRIEKLTPDEVYELDVEIWPTSVVCPPGYRLALRLMGHDFEYEKAGRMLHDSSMDRSRTTFGGKTTIHTGPERESFLLLPLIPA